MNQITTRYVTENGACYEQYVITDAEAKTELVSNQIVIAIIPQQSPWTDMISGAVMLHLKLFFRIPTAILKRKA